MYLPKHSATTRVVFLYQVLLAIASYNEQNLANGVGYTEQSISAILSRLYGVEYFCCSGKIMWSRLFLVLRSSCQEVFCEKDLRPGTLLKKETLALVFSCKCCEISNDAFSYRTSLAAASGYYKQVIPSRTFLLFPGRLYPVEDYATMRSAYLEQRYSEQELYQGWCNRKWLSQHLSENKQWVPCQKESLTTVSESSPVQ